MADRRSEKQQCQRSKMSRIHFGSICVLAATLTTAVTALAQSVSVDKQSIRNDALLLMGAGLSVPGFAAYCNKYVENNPALLKAAAEWNQRNWHIMEKTIQAIKWSGGLTNAEREYLDKLAFRLLKQEMEAEQDKASYCRAIASETDRRSLDLDKRTDTSSAARRIVEAPLQ